MMNTGETVYVVAGGRGRVIEAEYVRRCDEPKSGAHIVRVRVNSKEFAVGGYWICETRREAERFALAGLAALRRV